MADRSEVARHADFSAIRYAQCWEDADILLRGLAIQPGDVCLSIASAGDNALVMLAQNPARVVALDLSPAQLACLELRVAAYGSLEHNELLQLIGSRPATAAARADLYRRCRPGLEQAAQAFWDAHPTEIAAGVGGAGKFERYFGLFRTRILPLVHGRRRVARLLQGGGSVADRTHFYETEWNNTRWRLLFRVFFGRFVMGRLGRDPRFFKYVTGSVGDRILGRARHAVTALDPAANPYLQWILTGRHTTALPWALRAQNFDAIRANLSRLEWRCASLEEYLDEAGPNSIDRFNLSDIFEYMSPESYAALLARLVHAGRPNGRLAYWNMLAERRRPASMAAVLRPLDDLARELHGEDKAFFYSAFVVEEIV